MNIIKKTTVEFSITDMTEGQAQSLLMICVANSEFITIDFRDSGEFGLEEMLNNLRQALLKAGVKMPKG